MAVVADSEKGTASAAAGGTTPDAGGEASEERRAASRQRQPVTIDLTAADVRAAAASSSSASSAESTPAAKPEPAKEAKTGETKIGETKPGGEQRRSTDGPGTAQYFRGAAKAFSVDESFGRSLGAGAIGGVVALIVVLVLQSVSILPVPGRSAAKQAIQQAKAASDATAALDRRLTAVETITEAISGMRGDIKTLSDKVAALDAIRPAIASRGDVDTVAASVAALGKRLDSAPPAASRDDLAAISDRLGRLEAAVAAGGSGDGASSAAVTALSSQLADAAAQVRALGDRVTAAEAKIGSAGSAADGAAVKAVAVATLRRAAAGGQPFAAEVDMVANLGVDGSDVGVIRPLAATGVAAKAALAAEFPGVADAILAASSQADPNAGVVQRVLTSLGGLVTIRPVGPVAGSDPAAIVSRMTDDVGKGDLAAALSEREGLPPAAKDASADWATKAAQRIALDAAVERLAASLDTAKAG